ncbi:DUF7151 family protein [Thalassotalea sp. ND16A]|uniref:DUF7151 family protein n=1 Tax=Thalassotalea sp. ND16A TaxID=1535422 RepID=UPI00051A2302|nr:carboxypeptidase regulatory-like domain-containing protein [Thalassotalea sp. ND16A]
MRFSKYLFACLLFTLTACGGGGGGDATPKKPDNPIPPKNYSIEIKHSYLNSGPICANGGIEVHTGIDENGNGTLDQAEVDNTRTVCNGEDGQNGQDGSASLLTIVDEPAGDICLSGGININAGMDINADGNLDADEITKTATVCFAKDGEDGLTSLIATTEILAGEVCLTGGFKIETGIDLNNDGILDAAEVEKTESICNGQNGGNGNDGLTNLILTSEMAAGEDCPTGGFKIESGLDLNGDSTLSSDEVATTQLICNGQNGEDGTDGLSSLLATTEIQPGDICLTGGFQIETGVDLNNNGILDAGEVEKTESICNGHNGGNGDDGLTSLILTSEIAAGEDCPTGGFKIETGLDLNGDNTLSSDEVATTQLICNGQNGADGEDGANGLTSLLVTSEIQPGEVCLSGGIQLDSGLDLNENGILDVEEISQSTIVCFTSSDTSEEPVVFSDRATIKGNIEQAVVAQVKSLRARSILSSKVTENTTTLILAPSTITATATQSNVSDDSEISQPIIDPVVLAVDAEGNYQAEIAAGTDYSLVMVDQTANAGVKIEELSVAAGETLTQNITAEEQTATGSVNITVASLSSGQVIEGAVVKVVELVEEQTTPISGNVEFTGLPEGTYTLVVSKNNFVSKQLNFSIVSGQATDLSSIELNNQKGSAAGQLTASENENLANVLVYARAVDNSVYSTITNTSGTFTFPALPVGDGYRFIVVSNYFDSAKSTAVNILRNQTAMVETFELSRRTVDTGSLTGFVKYSDKIHDMDHAGIIVSVEGTDKEAVSARDGSFVINNLTAGAYNLNFTDSNYQTITQSVEIVTGTVVNLELIKLNSLKGALVGTVTSNDDSPLAGVNVVIHETGQSTTSDAAGQFTFTNHPIGNYTLIASHAGYGSQQIDVAINQGETTTLAENILLTPFNFSGQISLGTEQTDHSGVTITLSGTGYTEQSNEDGSFAFYAIKPGNYQLQFSRAGYKAQAISVVISEENNELGYIVYLEPQSGIVTGQASLNKRVDHSGVEVVFTGTEFKTFTDSTGKWSINLPVGNYGEGISYHKDYFAQQNSVQTITVTENGQFTVAPVKLIQNNANLSFNVSAANTCSGSLIVQAEGLNGDATGFSGALSVSDTGDVNQALLLGEYQFTISCSDSGWESVVFNVTLNDTQENFVIEDIALRQSFIIIDEGAEYTNDQQVSLAMGNTDAVEMRIVDGINDSNWLTFAEVYEHTLSAGDGIKTVTVRFRDINNVELPSVSDTIKLDTKLNIAYFTVSGASTKGDLLHLQLSLNQELGATVTATIPGLVQELPLLDNGFGGDTTANDGIYERDFYIDTPIDINLAALATVTDISGNTASLESDTNIVLNTPPTIKNLITSSNIASGEMILNFATDEPATTVIDFGSDLANLSNRLDVNATLSKTHSITLNGLSPNSMTYFRITANDSVNNYAEFEGQSKLAPPPVAGLGAYPGSDEVGLIWDPAENAAGYRIYRSEDGGNVFTLINANALISERYYVDALASNGTTYSYRVTAEDIDGNESDNGEAVEATPELTLAGPTEIAGGVIDANTVWLKSRSPYNISAKMKVKTDIELLLLPATEVAFTQADLSMHVSGKITALGQADNLVKLSAFEGANQNYSGALIFDTANTSPSALNFTELNYIKAYQDYSESYQRSNYSAPLALINSTVNGKNDHLPDFYIKSAKNSVVNEYGYGSYSGNYVLRVDSVDNVTFNKLNSSGEVETTSNYIARINSAVNSKFNGASFYFENGNIDNSQFKDAKIEYATSISNSTLTNTRVTGSNSLRINGSTLTNTQVTLSGDYARLTMHYSVLDAQSNVSAKQLDVSYNYWGSTDLVAITAQTSYTANQTLDTHLYPIITTGALYTADWDNDTIPDYIDYDNDNDGYSDLQEDWLSDPEFGEIFNPLDADSYPAGDKDNDMDGIADVDDLDDDNDGLLDSDELIRLTDKFLADSDGDGVNDGNEVSFKYNPLDKANYPLMGNISGKTIDNSNVNTEGVVYIAGYTVKDSMYDGGEYVAPVNLNNVTVNAGAALMIEKDTSVYFNSSVVEGTDANVITIRATGAGSGRIEFNNSQVAYANIKVAIGINIDQATVINRSDLSFNKHWNVTVNGTIKNSLISSQAYWHNYGYIGQSYITGNSAFWNQNTGVIEQTYINLSSIYHELFNQGEIKNSFASNHVYMEMGGIINDSVMKRLGGDQAANIANSDVQLYSNETRAAFFDGSYISNLSGSTFYNGFGEPVDQIGDGVAETVFELGGNTYTVDGINNPRSTPNFPNLVFKPYLEANGIWSPEGVGAWWDMNNADSFPESDPTENMGTISGQINLEGFVNHSGVKVELINTSLSTVTDAEGNWSVRLPARDYPQGISFSKDHIQTLVKNRSYSVTAHLDTDVGTINLMQATATVSGVLTIDESNDYTLATITASKNGQITSINPSDAGVFDFQALPLGDYIFEITYPNGSWETVSHELSLVAGETEYTLPVTRVRNSFVYINDGALYTNNPNVNLAITNANASNMQITEGGVVQTAEAFNASRELTLTAGDGEKTVQVDFTDASGNALTSAVSSITLDTQVNLTSLILSNVTTMNDILHLTLTANETGGMATVTIPGLVTDLALFDDGLNGDSLADDGVYETDYLIQSAEDITATPIATFVDIAGNSATINASTDLAISTSPTISDLLAQTVDGQLIITFTTNELTTATIWYGTDPNYLDQSLVITSEESLEHMIALAAAQGETIYFKIITDDGVTLATEIIAEAKVGNTALTGLNVSAGDNEIGLVWTKQAEATAYRIYRSEDSNIFTQVAEVTTDTPYFVDNSIWNDDKFYYRVTWLDGNALESDQTASVSATASIENAGATELNGGVIAVNEIWLKSRSPYIITGNMLIRESATLSLMPGTEIEFNGAKRHIMTRGNIMAYGSETEMVKISTDPISNYSDGENGDQSAIIYDTSNNTASEFNYTELNYLQVYYDYSDIWSRPNYLVPLSLSNSTVNGYYNSRPNFYIKSLKNSMFNEYGYGTGSYNNSTRIGTVDNTTFSKFNQYSGNPETTSRYIAKINNTVNSTFNGASFYFGNGSVENSYFVDARIDRATTIRNTTLIDSSITGSSSLRLTDNVLTNSDTTLTGDNTRLTMRFNVLDSESSVSAKYLDISHNYWGNTDLSTIAEQTGYAPDKEQDTHLYPVITGNQLYLADWDDDTIPDYLDYDNDNDGYSDLQEDWESDPVYGSIFNPLDAESHPATDPDNDMDGLIDSEDFDDDNDGLLDADESTYGTDPYLADSDGDGINDGDEVRYNYDPLDKANHPLMGNITGKSIDNSNVSSDGVVYIVGYSIDNDEGSYTQSVSLTNVTVNAGTAIMINKDTPVYFYDSVISGTAEQVVTVRSSGAGSGTLYLYNTEVNFANIKLALNWHFDSQSTVNRSDLSFNQYGNNYGTISNSYITASTSWNNYGVVEHNYLTGNDTLWNRNQGSIKASYLYSTSSSFYMNNYGELDSSFSNSRVYGRSNSSVNASILEQFVGADTGSVKKSDVQFDYSGQNAAIFFDNSYLSDSSGTAFYDGYGSPVDQLGDGVAETTFAIGSGSYTVDGINNPRSMKNFPNGVDDIWSPIGVGALWDANSADPTAFPEPVL